MTGMPASLNVSLYFLPCLVSARLCPHLHRGQAGLGTLGNVPATCHVCFLLLPQESFKSPC